MNENNLIVHSTTTAYAWTDGTMQASDTARVGSENATFRMYIHITQPNLPLTPRIQKAELTVHQASSVNALTNVPKLGLYQVTGEISEGTCTPEHNSDPMDFALLKVTEDASYVFDITKLVNAIYSGDAPSQNLVLKLIDESISDDSYAVLHCGDNAPTVSITYTSGYGVSTPRPTHTHDLGQFGQGSIDLAYGNLMFESRDFAWGGNRMPVTLNHLYNSILGAYAYTGNSSIMLNAADFSAMNLGLGWRMNVMQSMVAATDGRYVYIDESGNETYFKQSEDTPNLYASVTDGEWIYDSEKRTLVQGEETCQFDAAGRLISIADAHSTMHIVYTDGKITVVIDGVGREFRFAYNEADQLISITAPDDTAISYIYEAAFLKRIHYPDGSALVIDYTDSKPTQITSTKVNGSAGVAVRYTYTANRVTKVEEYASRISAEGKWSSYDYSSAQGATIVRSCEKTDDEDNILTMVYTFDPEGNVVSEYACADSTGNLAVNGAGTGVHPYFGGISTMATSQNMLNEHSFETDRSWQIENANEETASVSIIVDRALAKYGKKLLCIRSENPENTGVGAWKHSQLNAGTYTFSAYLRPVSGTGGVYLRVMDFSNNVLAQSEHLSRHESDYVRMAVTFTLQESQAVCAQILYDGEGVAYADAVQLEANTTATPYNLLADSSFDIQTWAWSLSDGASYDSEISFNGHGSMKMIGDMNGVSSVTQTVQVRPDRNCRETFTLSGWAKGYGLPNHVREGCEDPQFRLRAVVHYNDADYEDTGCETFTADFVPGIDEWQYASVSFSKSKYRTIDRIDVYCDYDYNCGTAWFDDLQLIRDGLETGLSPSDFPEEDYDESEATDTEDPYALPDFEELTDEFGNALTETTFTDGTLGTVYRSFGYDENGNDLVRETDARGNVTTYTVDPVTSRHTSVTDRCGVQTAYTYDAMGRTASVSNQDAQVSYTYDSQGGLSRIVRGDGMTYVLGYNDFHNLTTVGIPGRTLPLVQYAYKAGNGWLKQVFYANNDNMKATYNALGQLVAEKWYDANEVLTAHYQYGYDGAGNIVRTVDIFAQREYTYTYEAGVLVRATEYAVTFDESGFIVARSVVSALRYFYNEQGTLVRKSVTFADGMEQITLFDTDEDDCVTTQLQVNGEYIPCISKADSFGRKEYDELQLGRGFLSRRFSYHEGKITAEHQGNAKIKSAPTTHLVSRIDFSDGRSLSYEYDAEERITKVVESDGESFVSTTAYTYDAQGQLLTETVNGNLVNEMTYDGYGNILTKNGKAYTYGDAAWKDLLTAYDGQTIAYDAQGNPTNYLGHTLAWEKGRQLKSFDDISYTYNANGIRTSKIVDGVEHTYVLDGAKILRETWGINELVPLYDNEDSVCGILYNQVPYYFRKNLQGDIIAITDKYGETVARYTYDAWGKCTIVDLARAHEIATVNPFRYRGYYYDSETALYYLQSRYYDPEISRFLNADDTAYAVSGSIPQETNLFAYCLNGTVNAKDPGGTDAIWLQAWDSVCGMGHTGLLFQKKSTWYYWYWGVNQNIGVAQYILIAAAQLVRLSPPGFKASRVNINLVGYLARVAASTVLATAQLIQITPKKGVTSKNYEEAIVGKANELYESKTKFNKHFYIKGNFDKAYDFFSKLSRQRNYCLLFNNCMQTTTDGLRKGKFSQKNLVNSARMLTARGFTIPNIAYNYLKKYF